jgi:hypothetical protein
MSPSLDRVWNLDCRIVGGPPTKKAAAGRLPAGFSLRRTGSAASLTALSVAVDGLKMLSRFRASLPSEH